MKVRVVGVSLLLVVCYGLLTWAASVERYKRYRMVGFSMEPTIANGSWVIVDHAVKIEDVKVGDVVLFIDLNTKKKVCHRVQRKQASDLLVVRGDNNRFRDPILIGRMAYRGVVVRSDSF